MTPTTAVQFSSPGLTWCGVKALQDHETVINVIYAVVGGTEKFSEVAERTKRDGAEAILDGNVLHA